MNISHDVDDDGYDNARTRHTHAQELTHLHIHLYHYFRHSRHLTPNNVLMGAYE